MFKELLKFMNICQFLIFRKFIKSDRRTSDLGRYKDFICRSNLAHPVY